MNRISLISGGKKLGICFSNPLNHIAKSVICNRSHDSVNYIDHFMIFGQTNFQIGQCRIFVDLKKTREFYSTLPKITENCNCDDCNRFERDIINRPSRLFDMLRSMEVDLRKQPNINPDGISCIGEVRENEVGYLGYYHLYGHFGKVTKKSAVLNGESKIGKVVFANAEFGGNNEITIKRIDDEKISVEFYIEVAKNL